jgi:sugar-specific transcriptional regulator TrmB
MSENTDTIDTFLSLLKFTPEEQQVFRYINKNGASTALEISKFTNISRTKVYRILDIIMSKKMLYQVVGDRGLKFEIPANLDFSQLLFQRENEIDQLYNLLPAFKQELASNSMQGKHESKVVYFHGIRGLEQVTWNSTKAKNYLRIYELSENMTAFLEYKFSEKVRREFVKNKITTKQLTNSAKIKAYTKVSELVKKYWHCRYINSSELSIKFETLIYNDVLALYTYQKGQIFCVEIHNPYLAQMQSQIFDFIWKGATPLHIVDDQGTASVIK